jgi:chromosomal replication initiator protein DnaA
VDLNPRYRFESFVIGPTNRLAATAAQTVAGSPGSAYNPLFIYARSGLGKTHLLQAIGHAALDLAPSLRVQYLTLEEFVEQYHAAVAAGQSDAFRRSVQETELLLIDDVQFLCKHREMQSELLRLAEAQAALEGQLVLTSDRPPAEIQELDERLISRLSGGLLVDMAVPDYETRLVILKRKAEERGAQFAAGVLEALAEPAVSNVRELVGLVNRLVAFQAVSEAPLTAAGARVLLAADDGSTAERPLPPRAAAPPPAAPAAPAAPAVDEFSAFLSAVTRTVALSLDAWRSRVGEAVMRWQGEGYRTARLEALLQRDDLPDVDQHLEQYAAEVEELRKLADEVAALDPQAAGHARFRDPDRVEEARSFAARVAEGAAPPPAPSASLRFEDYVVGPANEAVVRAAKLAADQPGTRYNPLFIAGPSGVGKSHLLHAVGNALAAAGGGGRVVACLSAQTFVEELVSALGADNVDWWRRRYRRVDALLLDDVQLLAGKEQSQDELFNLFDVLNDAEKQMVFAADHVPSQLEGLAARLVSRFEGGLLVELAPPDRAMRETLVRRYIEQQALSAAGDVVEYLAARPADSARAVQGLVNKALSAMDEGEAELTLSAARRAIEGRASRPSQAQAISALIPSGLDPALSSREKIVWDWPDMGERLIEELR